MENTNNCCPDNKCHKPHHSQSGFGAYGLAFLGMAIYNIQHSDTFWLGVLGILKAMVWPAFLVYKLTAFLK
jgi:hypothetical protein